MTLPSFPSTVLGVATPRSGAMGTRVTFQLAAHLAPLEGQDAFAAGIEVVLEWVGREFAGLIPVTRDSFEFELPGKAVHCIAVPEDGLWALRLVQGAWTTEISLVQTKEGADVGVRSFCTSPPGEEIQLARPQVVVDLASRCPLREARPLDGRPWHLATSEDVEEFHRFLTGDRRALPVYLLTQPAPGKLGIDTKKFLLDAEGLARRTLGVAYVVTLPMALGFHWTQLVGKTWSAYLGAVRTYWPRVRFEDGSPYEHPLKMAEGVLAFRYRDLTAEAAFTEMLVDQALRHAASARIEWGRRRFLEDARIRRAELARMHAPGDTALVEALGQKIASLEEEREFALGLAGDFEAAALTAEDEAARLRAQLDALRRDFIRKTGTNPDALLRFPETYAEIEEWVRANLPGRVVLHPRALRSLRNGAFEDVTLVGRALLLLANEYRNMQLGGEAGALELFTAACERLGLRYGRAIERSRAGEEGETYFVQYGKERRFLEFHLRKGGDKDPRYCLGIYFFWDEESGQVVVGWVPGHLENRMT